MLLPDDAALPHLPSALDPAIMQAAFQSNWAPVAGVRITACQIERVKYRPGESCLVSYLLQLDHPTAGLQEQRFCAYLYPPGQSAAHWAKAQAGIQTAPRWGPALCHWPTCEMVLRAFPNDRKLTTLAALTDPHTLQHQLLPPLVAAHWGAGWQIGPVQTQVAQYFPEHNCMVRVTAKITEPGAAQQQQLLLYAKSYYNQAGAETNQLMRALWASEARRTGRLVMAQPLAYDAERKILWQRGVPGETLLAYENQSAAFAHYLAQAAQLVATLHQQPLRPSRTQNQVDWAGKLQAVGAVLARIWPEGEARFRALVDRLLQQPPPHAAEPVALLHGDLHLQNFLGSAGQLALIDLDDLTLGSPWQEVGSFLAGLHYRAIRNGTPGAEVAPLAATFCQHYAAHAPWSLPPAALRWYTASALLTERVARLISRLTKGDLDAVIQLVARAEAISAGM